jgi:hypothetical protein
MLSNSPGYLILGASFLGALLSLRGDLSKQGGKRGRYWFGIGGISCSNEFVRFLSRKVAAGVGVLDKEALLKDRIADLQIAGHADTAVIDTLHNRIGDLVVRLAAQIPPKSDGKDSAVAVFLFSRHLPGHAVKSGKFSRCAIPALTLNCNVDMGGG